MREIKFRVWDRDRKLIGYNRFNQGRWSCQMLKPGGSGEWSNGVLHGPHMDQFTGLTGRNGVEIFEDDVVRRDHPDPDFVLIADVYWEADSASWAVRYEPNPANYTRGWQSQAEWARWEVIGNTHDKPDRASAEAGE